MKIKTLFKLFRNVKIKSFKEGEIIIAEGAFSKNIHFIRRGLVRIYHHHENGDEITFQLYAENQSFVNIHSALFDEKSKFTYQALEATKLYIINTEKFREVSSKNPEIMELSRTFFGKKVFSKVFERVESFVFLSAEERYKKYVKDNPNIVNRAPDIYIANVLGITAVSLSRIRSRIVSKKK